MGTTTNSLSRLTKYKPASVIELWVIAWPLIISALSGNLMLFVDRILLANYSTESMNSAAAAGMATLIFVFSTVSIASIAEVFVGQHNGARRIDRVAEPVWQMLFFSLAMLVVFWPVAIWGPSLLVPNALHKEGDSYMRILMVGGPLLPMFAALSAFFAGRGKTKIITIAAISANLLNCLLDYLLIFGHPNLFEPLGATGAAVATVFSQLLQMIILLAVFLNATNRHIYGTHRFLLIRSTLLDCLRLGYPNALSHLVEMSAWCFLFYIVAAVGTEYVTILTLGQTLYILFAFFTDGMQKGVISIASNLLGAKQRPMLNTLLLSAFKLHCIIIAVLALPLLVYPDFLLHLFAIDTIAQQDMSDQYRTCQYVWLYVVFDGFLWVFAALLTALGDTLFIMVVNTLGAWLFSVLPLYIIIHFYGASAHWIWGGIDLYAAVTLMCLALRYKHIIKQPSALF